jgi:hypothetical protein
MQLIKTSKCKYLFTLVVKTIFSVYFWSMALITLDVPSESHLKIKQLQLTKEVGGKKLTLKQVYYEVIEKGLEALEKKTPTK